MASGPFQPLVVESVATILDRETQTAIQEWYCLLYTSAILAMHLTKGTRGKLPFEQCETADANWMVEILAGTCTVAIEGHRERLDAKPGHECSFQDHLLA